MNTKMTTKPKILLVEDEESLAKGLEYNLTEEGYEVKIAKNGKEAIEIFDNENFDLIILDIMLPFKNGFEIAEYIRSKNPQIPILMLTVKSSIEDKIKGLEIGADDYLTKPFHLKELLLRIAGMIKRRNWYIKSISSNPIFRFGKNEINFENLTVKHKENIFQITQLEAILLRYLIENRDRVITRKELLEKVWNINAEIETRTVDIFISRLRKYFEDDPSNPVHIKSVRGLGYIFEVED